MPNKYVSPSAFEPIGDKQCGSRLVECTVDAKLSASSSTVRNAFIFQPDLVFHLLKAEMPALHSASQNTSFT